MMTLPIALAIIIFLAYIALYTYLDKQKKVYRVSENVSRLLPVLTTTLWIVMIVWMVAAVWLGFSSRRFLLLVFTTVASLDLLKSGLYAGFTGYFPAANRGGPHYYSLDEHKSTSSPHSAWYKQPALIRVLGLITCIVAIVLLAASIILLVVG